MKDAFNQKPCLKNETLRSHLQESMVYHPNSRICFSSGSYTYKDLDEKASILAALLNNEGIRSKHRVALYFQRDHPLILSLFSLIKMHCTILILDPNDSDSRIQHMLATAKIDYILSSKLTGFLKSLSKNIVNIPNTNIHIMCSHNNNMTTTECLKEGEGGFIFFTSGTTSQGKAVFLSQSYIHQCMINLLARIPISSQHQCIHSASFSFVSSLRFFLFVYVGAQIHLVPRSLLEDVNEYIKFILGNRVNVLDTVPSYYKKLCKTLDLSPEIKQVFSENLHILLSSGEQFAHETFSFLKHNNTLKIYSLYGQTESGGTVCLYGPLVLTDETNVLLGTPLEHVRFLLLKEDLTKVQIGETGEIYLSGQGRPDKYLDSPQLSQKNFLAFMHEKQEVILYKTGDLGVLLAPGKIKYQGRVDLQIKHHGIRIEPESIELILKRNPHVADCVLFTQHFGEEQLLICLYERKDNTSLSMGQFHDYAYQHLPQHLIPNLFIPTNAIPRLPNYKIDRKNVQSRLIDDYLFSLTESPGANQKGEAQPFDLIELYIKDIWNKILPTPQLNRETDFFMSGGDSLLVTSMIISIEKIAKVRLSTKEFFAYKTLSGLSKLIKFKMHLTNELPGKEEQAFFKLILLKQESSNTQEAIDMIIFPGSTSTITNPIKWSQSLHEFHGTIWGTEYPKLNNAIPFTLKQIARSYCNEIIKNELNKVVLLGISFGSLVAYEVAYQLRESPVVVIQIALYDSFPVPYDPLKENKPSALNALLLIPNAFFDPKKLIRHMNNFLNLLMLLNSNRATLQPRTKYLIASIKFLFRTTSAFIRHLNDNKATINCANSFHQCLKSFFSPLVSQQELDSFLQAFSLLLVRYKTLVSEHDDFKFQKIANKEIELDYVYWFQAEFGTKGTSPLKKQFLDTRHHPLNIPAVLIYLNENIQLENSWDSYFSTPIHKIHLELFGHSVHSFDAQRRELITNTILKILQ